MLPGDTDHAAYVEAWLKSVDQVLSAAELVTLLERALDALWTRSQVTLGEVTLTAIGERVLHLACEKYPVFWTLKIEEHGIRFDDFRRQDAFQNDPRFPDAVRFLLVEFLTVLGKLTDEILTPALHEALWRVAPEARRARAEGDAGPAEPPGDGDDDGGALS